MADNALSGPTQTLIVSNELLISFPLGAVSILGLKPPSSSHPGQALAASPRPGVISMSPTTRGDAEAQLLYDLLTAPTGIQGHHQVEQGAAMADALLAAGFNHHDAEEEAAVAYEEQEQAEDGEEAHDTLHLEVGTSS